MKVPVGALQDAIAPFAGFPFEAFLAADDQRVVVHFNGEVILVPARHFDPHDQSAVVFVNISGQVPPKSGQAESRPALTKAAASRTCPE